MGEKTKYETKYEMVFIDEGEGAAFISLEAIYKLAELAKYLPHETSITTDIGSEYLPGILKESKVIYDQRAGSFALYLNTHKGFIKISVEPESLEELTDIEVTEEIKCKDFGGLVKKIKDLLRLRE